MTPAHLMVPETVGARARPFKRLGVAFGPRFFVLLATGLMWLGPALFEPRFVYAMVGWDVLVVWAWLLDVRRLPAPAALALRRSWRAPSALSVQSHVRLTLVNESAATLRTAILDAVPHQLCPEPPSVRLNVAPHGEAEADYPIVPTARGEIAIGDAYIRYQSPLRIAERWAQVGIAQTIVTYPNLDEAKRASVHVVRSQQIEMERRSRRRRGAGRSFESLREHQRGDEFRDICWTASARRGKLVTQVHEIERSQPIWIVIDAGRLMRARVAAVTKLDHAVNAALSLTQVALGSGDRVGLLAYGRRISHRLPAARGSAHLRRIMEHLAIVRAEESEADHLLAAGRLLTDQKRRSLIVWITDVPDTAMTPEVVAAASQLMGRHLVLFVVIGQPDLQRVAMRRAATADEMYETAAAQEVVHRRDVLLARLRSQGALALEAGAKLSPALVNAYLDVKQRNRL
jgi:uncharacterized protein (DUF58 family)